MDFMERIPSLEGETIDQVAGITGIGWTTSLLVFLTTAIGYSNSLISRFMSDSRVFLYAGVVFFLMTLGLDRVANRLPDDDRSH